jgi:xanthine dehydrogenase/oxidase
MSLVPCKYYVNLNAALLPWPILISIYENDGSVAVTHGGIEMGQGINTKVAQVVASVLELSSASEVCIKPADGLTSANACVTGGSMASELVCQVFAIIY